MEIKELYDEIKKMFPTDEVSVNHCYQENLSSPEHWMAMVYRNCPCPCGHREVLASALVIATPELVLANLAKQREAINVALVQ